VRLRSLVLLLALGAAAPVQAEPVADLAALIRRSSDDPSPVLSFLTGFQALADFELDRVQVAEALRLAGVPDHSAIERVLQSSVRVRKQGNAIAIDRTSDVVLTLGNGAGIELGRKVRFELSRGDVKEVGRLEAADPGPGYFHVREVEGIRVGETVSSLYPLQHLYYVQESGVPVIHLRAGYGWPFRDWRRLPLPSGVPDVSADAPAPPHELAAVGERGDEPITVGETPIEVPATVTRGIQGALGDAFPRD